MEKPEDLMRKSLESGRIDVLRSILVEIGLKKEFHEIVDSAASTDVGTLLHYAASQGDADGVRALLSSGANPCVQNDKGETPLQSAKNDDIRSAFTQELLQAVAQSKLGRVCQLLSAGVPIDSLDSPISRNTPLHWAASFGSEDVVKVLCEGGALLTVANAKGETPLHDAVNRGDVSVVRRLLQYGADPAVKNLKGKDAYELAKLKPDVLQCLSIHNVSQTMRKSDSLESLETASLASMERAPMLPLPTSPAGRDRFLLAQEFKLEQWTDILWPQPKQLALDPGGKVFVVPQDRKIRVFFHSASEADPRQMMQIWTLYVPTLSASQLGLEWMDYEGALELANDDAPPPSAGDNQSAVAPPSGVGGVTCGVLRDIFDRAESYVMTRGHGLQGGESAGILQSQSAHNSFRSSADGQIQLAVFQVTVIPSLDLNTSSADKNTVKEIVGKFLSCFPHSKAFHFGSHLAPVLTKYPALLEMVHYHYSSMVYLSFESFAGMKGSSRISVSKKPLPAYCIVCVPGKDLIQESAQQELARSSLGGGICLKFTTSDVGYLCQAPETMVKNAILAAKLGQRCPVLGTMVCDLSTGCEIMPQSLAFLPEVAVLGVSWNRDTDMKRFCFLLPQIGAEHILLDRTMAAVFQQILTLGYVEHELTKLGYGLVRVAGSGTSLASAKSNGIGSRGNQRHMNGSAGPSSMIQNGPSSVGVPPQPLSPPPIPGGGLSVIVQLLLNPDSMTLERLTPVTFKKARVELTRSLQALNAVKKDLPYNYELALTLAEIQLVTELMILATNLLELRSKFQHTWLSRNQPDTLGNAVKIFDNLFRTLLPPDMQAYGDNLL